MTPRESRRAIVARLAAQPFALGPPPAPLDVRGIADGSTGYGQMTEHLCRGLEREGIKVAFSPAGVGTTLPVAAFLRDRYARSEPDGPLLQMLGPMAPFPAGSIVLTMYETTRIEPAWADNLDRARVVIVPCDDNARWFRDSGVTAPIRVVPLGIDPAVYHPTVPEPEGTFVVGCAGRVGAQGDRKRLGLMARLFVEAFPAADDPDARLRIKCWPGCRFDLPDDPRIEVDRGALTDEGLADWYRSLSVFASASLGEGWGLQPHQAMACGRPTIAPFWGGHRHYMTAETSWPVEFAEPHHCHVDEGSMVARLREARADRAGRLSRGEAAARRAAEFTWERSGRELAAVVREFGLAPARPAPPDDAALRLAMRADTCEHGSGPCGCGNGPPRICTKGGGRREVRRADCLRCVAGETP